MTMSVFEARAAALLLAAPLYGLLYALNVALLMLSRTVHA